MTSTLLLAARDLSYHAGGRRILHKVSLSLAERQIVTLIGPNGAGKTTLVRLLLGLERPSAGSVERREGLRVGYMPQRLAVERSMPLTVRKFLHLAVHARRERLGEVLDEVGGANLLDSQIHALSGGELQRVLLARALIQDPELLVLDEPAQGVDVNGQAELYRLITRIRDRHDCGVLMVSHDLHLVMSATDEVLCLNQHICCHGHPDKVSTDPAYLELFGRRHAEALAVYTHHHNHRHDFGGTIVKPDAKPDGHHG